ncbi:MAG: pentapeptide repeat-containing protein [Nitrospinales bacterium]
MLQENKWTHQEKWVWEQLKAGEVAAFNTEPGYGGKLDPKNPQVWEGKGNRVLRPRFLKTILLDEERRKILMHKKVCIWGIRFTEYLDLSDAKLANFLALDNCRFEEDVSFSRLQTPNLISLQGSTFAGTLNMNGLQVDGSLFMRGKATFNEVDLCGAKIGGQLDMDGSTFNGKLNMDSLQVESDLFMSGKAKFNEVDLCGARIGGQLSMNDSIFTGKLDMDSLRVEGHLFISPAEFESSKPVNLVMAKIGGGLTLAGSKGLPSLDLTGAEIGGEFMLAKRDEYATWRDDAKLTLRNARVRAIQDCLEPKVWPSRLEREGFTYDWLGGFSADNKNDMANREVTWYLDWLKNKQETFSPQPYKQLADVLENHGHKDKADIIRYASKERELELAKSWEKGWRFLQKIFIGYGYRYRFTLMWVLGLIFVGFIWLCASQSGPTDNYEKIIFCLDKFLPLVKFREEFDLPKLTFCIQLYFDFLQIMGYVLVSYLIAGLSGLTKK